MKTSAAQCAGKQSGPTRTVTITVGTAGHIDHGKTALVKMLTGCDCDTLPEEKARGMTIDLGFAACTLPNDRRVGIVDVPGHERFVHNMVAGASGIDVAMLVIACDDGIMPQTLEHFHILRLLGVTAGLLVLTKIDLVPPERVADVAGQVRSLVAGSFLERAPILPVSSKTGQGYDAFYDAFVSTVDRTASRDCHGAFRMHVESSYVVQGLGTIVSGIPRSGTVRLGDTLELLPDGGEKKVKGLQVYGEDAGEGKAGECVALRLSDLAHGDVRRGMVLAAPGYFEPARLINARLALMANLDRPLKPRSGVRFHIGTAEATGYLVLPGTVPPAPGSEVYVQFQLNEPVVAAPGDFYVVRWLSPVRIIGGGTVISQETVKMRRSRGDFVQAVEAREKAFSDPVSALEYALKSAGSAPRQVADLARDAYLDHEAAHGHLRGLVEKGRAVLLPGDRYVNADAMAESCGRILEALGRLHDATPLSIGFPGKDLLRDMKIDRLVVDRAIELMQGDGRISVNASGYQIPSRAPRLLPGQAALASKVSELYRNTGFASPRSDELPEKVGAPARVIGPVFDFLIQTGELVALSDKVVLHKDLVAESRRALVEYLLTHGSIEAGEFKDVIGATRKYAIPILEYWDARGLTRRVGNARQLKGDPQTGS
ncbi:MAG: selenocysteine-specific translation elongation factor [bacterium]